MLYVKEHYPAEKFESSFLELWVCLWREHRDISKPDQLANALLRHFSRKEVDCILAEAATSKYKQALKDKTKFLVDRGAFGAPWYLVRNSQGRTEPFFGSDRQVVEVFDRRCYPVLILLQVSVYVAFSWS